MSPLKYYCFHQAWNILKGSLKAHPMINKNPNYLASQTLHTLINCGHCGHSGTRTQKNEQWSTARKPGTCSSSYRRCSVRLVQSSVQATHVLPHQLWQILPSWSLIWAQRHCRTDLKRLTLKKNLNATACIDILYNCVPLVLWQVCVHNIVYRYTVKLQL